MVTGLIMPGGEFEASLSPGLVPFAVICRQVEGTVHSALHLCSDDFPFATR